MKYKITVTAKHPVGNVHDSSFIARWEFTIDVDEDEKDFIRDTPRDEGGIPISEKLIFVKDLNLESKEEHPETPDYVIYCEQGWGCGKAISFFYFEGVELNISFPKPINE